VSIVLDPLSSNDNRWRDLVLLTLERYALANHVLFDMIFPGLPAWRRMDAVVLSWIFGTITIDLMDGVRDRSGMARSTWLAITDQFLSNRETRTLHLDAEFRIFTQGDLSINDYCRKMKAWPMPLAISVRSSTIVLSF
jgi:hypothetical protein